MTKLASLVLFSAHPERTGAFYRAIGLPLEAEDHGDGPRHLAADVAGVHLAVYQADPAQPQPQTPAWRDPGSSFPGFWVPSLEAALAALTDLSAPVLALHQPRPWGCRAIVQDPDGRSVELNQQAHCPDQ
jgi:lactoylglutathione lyase